MRIIVDSHSVQEEISSICIRYKLNYYIQVCKNRNALKLASFWYAGRLAYCLDVFSVIYSKHHKNYYYYLKCLLRPKDILQYSLWCITVHALSVLIFEILKDKFFHISRDVNVCHSTETYKELVGGLEAE